MVVKLLKQKWNAAKYWQLAEAVMDDTSVKVVRDGNLLIACSITFFYNEIGKGRIVCISNP